MRMGAVLEDEACHEDISIGIGRKVFISEAKMATPLVGVRTGARHEDGRYTDMLVSE